MDNDRQKTPIKFNFHPFEIDKGNHAVYKSEGSDGVKRRYLKGISSGIKIDGHGERMTDKCIKSFMDQATQGDILLYPDVHGIQASSDIGILTKAEVMPNGDWLTEYRLHDARDGIGANKMEKINDIWKQIRGDKPYTVPRQKGFSIEGFIPDEGIVTSDMSGGKRVINNVELDGVILVPRPAYKDSVANAIYKALGEVNPHRENNLRKQMCDGLKGVLHEKVMGEELKDNY